MISLPGCTKYKEELEINGGKSKSKRLKKNKIFFSY